MGETIVHLINCKKQESSYGGKRAYITAFLPYILVNFAPLEESIDLSQNMDLDNTWWNARKAAKEAMNSAIANSTVPPGMV